MRFTPRHGSRALVVLLASAAMLAPTPASAWVYRSDDGTMEGSLDFDFNDDYAAKRFYLLPGDEDNVKTATLWVYAKGQNCTATGGLQTLSNNGTSFLTYDPCTLWSSSSYGWHSFDVPPALLVDDENQFRILDNAVTWADQGAFFGMDTHGSGGYSAAYANYVTSPGELMWFLVTTHYRGGRPARGVATIHRLANGAATFALSPSSAGWTCVDVHTGASVTTGSSLAVPNPGVQCEPSASYGEWCHSVNAGGYQAAGGLGTLRVTSACTYLSSTVNVTSPAVNPNASGLVTGSGYTPWRCTVNDASLPTPVDYTVFCAANVDTQNT